MKWLNLKEMKCPKCSNLFIKGASFPGHACSKCDFYISSQKFDEIVGKMYHSQKMVDSRYKDIEDNLSSLNNLGHSVVADDFSDSPFLNK